MITLYGIKNCDTMKKARQWLQAHGVDYRFHDYRTDGLAREQLQTWAAELGWESLLNKRGTTWRQQPATVKDRIDEASAIELMLAQPALIKRPLLDHGSTRRLGFKADDYAALFDR